MENQRHDDDDDRTSAAAILMPSTDSTIVDAMDELKALTDVMQALRAVNGDAARTRILAAAAAFYKLSPSGQLHALQTSHHTQGNVTQPHSGRAFSEERPASPKDFVSQKQPKTDVERVACLAYFLAHYRDTPAFKTIDISKLNTEAAQPKFSNAAVAVENAAKSRYLVPASKGNKQISAMGERFVQALPDREAAKEALLMVKQRRKRKVLKGDAYEEDGE